MTRTYFFAPSFNGTAIVDANNAGSLTVDIVESITRRYQGTLMVTGTGNGMGQGTGSGSIGNNAFTGTAELTFDDGHLSVLETLRFTDWDNCAAEYRATNLARQ